MSSTTSEGKLATANTILSAVGSVAAAAMVARSLTQDFLPDELRDYFLSSFRSILSRFSSETTMIVDEFNGLENNQIYEAAETYLGTKLSTSNRRLKVSKPESENSIQLTADRDEGITDTFNGIRFKWIQVCRRVESRHFYNPRDMNSTMRSELRYFELRFHNKHRDEAVGDYLPWMLDQAKMLRAQMKKIKIYTLDRDEGWDGINLNHPATFDTLAMDDELKSTIEDDLKRFVSRKEYYKRVGKAWKRGYLLFGPPGTGKSSLIAAVANYLNFDIYDLDLTEIHSNSELRRLLVTTANRSILVVEDIDCSVELRNREAEANHEDDDSTCHPQHPGTKRRVADKKITLSGVLNFIDGLWSSCGDERIIILTTNHKERLDPALLRPGRMDMHIHMSYLTPCGFRILAKNYLGILKDHHHHLLFEEIEELIRCVHVTPAEAAEQLMKEDNNADCVLQGLVEFLRSKLEVEGER